VHQRYINLTFHGIGEPDRPLEPGEDAVWVSRARFHSVLDSVAGRTDVRITFDDGNASDVAHALPALRSRGLHATFFLLAGRLETPDFVDRDGVRALADAGMTIGCHGMRHRRWRELDDGELHEELVDARRLLEEVVERPVTEAGCPFGGYDRRVLRSLRRYGYERVYTSDRGTARPGAWIQARNSVGPADDAGLLDRILSADRRPHAALRRRTTLIAKRWR
jgi:peptidoglycan/xylan/chitin deacetylase (PgdA/CDA1 family)